MPDDDIQNEIRATWAEMSAADVEWSICKLCKVPIASEGCSHVERIDGRVCMSATQWERLLGSWPCRTFEDADLAKLVLFGPLYVFDKHPTTLDRLAFIDSLYAAGFAVTNVLYDAKALDT